MTRPQTLRNLAAAALCLGMISACVPASPPATVTPDLSAPPFPTSTPTPAPTPSPTPYAALSLDPSLLKGVRVVFIHPWSGEPRLAIERMTAEFNAKNIWGIRVNLIAAGSAGEQFNLVHAAIEDGGLPQAAAASPDHAAAWAASRPDILIDFTPFIQDAEWGMRPEEVEDYYPSFWEQTIRDGRQTGIPAQRSLQVLVYNRTWAEELGFDKYPETAADFQEQVCAATRANLADPVKEKAGTGGYILSTDSASQLAWMTAFGLNPAGLETNEGYRFEGTPAEESLTYLRKLFDLSCAWLSRNPQPFEYFAARQALAYAASTADLPRQEAAMNLAGGSDQWSVIPFPGTGGRKASLLSGLDYVILDSNPPEELASWIFIHWLMLPRHQVELAAAGSSLPLSVSAADGLANYGQEHPQWREAVSLSGGSAPAPAQPDWRVVRNLLEDAAWQSLQPTPQPAGEILRQLDGAIPEMIK